MKLELIITLCWVYFGSLTAFGALYYGFAALANHKMDIKGWLVVITWPVSFPLFFIYICIVQVLRKLGVKI